MRSHALLEAVWRQSLAGISPSVNFDMTAIINLCGYGANVRRQPNSGCDPWLALQQPIDVVVESPMRALMPFIACLMLIIAGLSSVAHVTEVGGNSAVSATELATCHSAGDLDEVPADSDRDYPHHHAICHGHDVATPAKALAAYEVRAEKSPTRAQTAIALIGHALDTPLRPPTA